MTDTIVVVTGGRSYDNFDEMYEALHYIRPVIVAHGGCSGADSLASKYCRVNGLNEHVYHANWGKHGKAAGPIRNKHMLHSMKDVADKFGKDLVLVAFPGGRGTANCVKEAESIGIEIIRVLK